MKAKKVCSFFGFIKKYFKSADIVIQKTSTFFSPPSLDNKKLMTRNFAVSSITITDIEKSGLSNVSVFASE